MLSHLRFLWRCLVASWTFFHQVLSCTGQIFHAADCSENGGDLLVQGVELFMDFRSLLIEILPFIQRLILVIGRAFRFG